MKTVKLMLHAGGQRATIDEVAAVRTPNPTDSWCPIGHLELLQALGGALHAQGFNNFNAVHALAHGGARLFSLMQIQRADEAEAEKGYGYVLAVRNSHDKTFPITLGVGSAVFVCDNLAFSADVRVSRRHTTYAHRDLEPLLSRAVGLLSEKWTNQDKRFEAYQQTELGERDAHDIIVRAFRGGVMPCAQIKHVLKEWDAPSYPEFAERRNVWRLMQAFTTSAKGRDLWGMPQRTVALHGILDTACGLGREAAESIIVST